MALTIALRLALGCVYESPFSRCLEYWLIHNAAQDLCVSYHLASDRDIVNRQHRGQKASHTRFYTRSRRFFPAAGRVANADVGGVGDWELAGVGGVGEWGLAGA